MGGSNTGTGGGGGGRPSIPRDPRTPFPQDVEPCPEAFSARLVDAAQVLPNPAPTVPIGSILDLVDDEASIRVDYQRSPLGYLPLPSVSRIRRCAERGINYSAHLSDYIPDSFRVDVILTRQ